MGVHINDNVDATHLKCRTENKKGEENVYECVNPLRAFETYNEEHIKQTGTSVVSPFQ